MTSQRFPDTYFSFLLSGRADDFRMASEAFQEAVGEGVSLETLQGYMDVSHMSAEMLCLVLDNGPVGKTE